MPHPGVIAIALLAALVAGCEQSPTGRSRVALVPEGQMIELGARSFAEIKQARTVVTDARINAVVGCVAGAIAAEVDGGPQAWEVVVFRDPSPNAFALPGGKIGIHTGILDVTDNESQLATIVGHEVAHVIADHANERMTQELGFNVLFLLLDLFVGGEGLERELLLRTLGLGARFGVLLPFSRVHEEEADVLGLRLMVRAGFDPRESLAFWRNMARVGGDQPPELLSTHPAHDTRSETLAAEMDAALELRRQAVGDAPPRRCA